MSKQFIVNRLGNKKNDIKYFKEFLPFDNIESVIEPFGGSFAVSRICYLDDKYQKFVNDNDKRLYKVYTQPENYKKMCEDLNTLANTHINEKGNVVYKTAIEKINQYNGDKDLLEYWKQHKITLGTNIKVYKKLDFGDSIGMLKKINFSNEDWLEYTKKFTGGEKNFIFLDPPYLFSDNSSYQECKGINSDITDILYKIYEILIDTNTKAKIMLIINDMKILRWLYKDFIKGDYAKIYQIGKRKENHLIITNY